MKSTMFAIRIENISIRTRRTMVGFDILIVTIMLRAIVCCSGKDFG